MPMPNVLDEKWNEMIKAFLKLTPEQRSAEAEKRLEETLERMSEIYNIPSGEAYEKLIKNRDRIYGSFRGKDGDAKVSRDNRRRSGDFTRHPQNYH